MCCTSCIERYTQRHHRLLLSLFPHQLLGEVRSAKPFWTTSCSCCPLFLCLFLRSAKCFFLAKWNRNKNNRSHSYIRLDSATTFRQVILFVIFCCKLVLLLFWFSHILLNLCFKIVAFLNSLSEILLSDFIEPYLSVLFSSPNENERTLYLEFRWI